MKRNIAIKATPVDAMIDGLGNIINMYLYAIIDIENTIDFSLLKKSLYHLYQEEPVIGARYTRKNRRSVWIVDPKPAWECIEYNNIDDKKAQQIEEGFIQEPKPYIEVLPISLYLLHMNTCDRLIIQVNHLLSDAGGIKTLLYRLFKIYNDLKNNIDSHKPLPKSGSRSEPSLLKAARISNIGKIVCALPGDLMSSKPVPSFFIPMSDSKARNGKTALLPLGSGRLTMLKNRWKNEDITINDILLAALGSGLYACFSHVDNQHSHLRIFITTDMRKYLPHVNYIGNFSFNTIIDTKAPSSFPPSHYLQLIAARTRKWKKDYTGLGAAIILSSFLRILPDKIIRNIAKNSPPTIVFTNMGLLDEKKLSYENITCINARINPPLALPPSLIAGATGFEDTVTFYLGYWTSAFEQEKAEMLIKELDRQLALLE